MRTNLVPLIELIITLPLAVALFGKVLTIMQDAAYFMIPTTVTIVARTTTTIPDR